MGQETRRILLNLLNPGVLLLQTSHCQKLQPKENQINYNNPVKTKCRTLIMFAIITHCSDMIKTGPLALFSFWPKGLQSKDQCLSKTLHSPFKYIGFSEYTGSVYKLYCRVQSQKTGRVFVQMKPKISQFH